MILYLPNESCDPLISTASLKLFSSGAPKAMINVNLKSAWDIHLQRMSYNLEILNRIQNTLDFGYKSGA